MRRRRRLHLVAVELRGLMQIRSDVGPSRHTLSVCHGLSQRGPGHPRTPAQTTNQAWLCVQLLIARTYLHHAAESRRLLATRLKGNSCALTILKLLRYVIRTRHLPCFATPFISHHSLSTCFRAMLACMLACLQACMPEQKEARRLTRWNGNKRIDCPTEIGQQSTTASLTTEF